MAQYYVYILASFRGALYTGVTNNLERRLHEHKHGLGGRFTRKYKVSKLVYFEATGDVYSAITREKEIKGWRRAKKVGIIEAMNPYWQDLASGTTGSPSSAPDPSLHSG